MLICPSCGEENPERARFCLACGTELTVAPTVGEERKVVSVLFVDLVGFTDRSDRADPEDVRATLRPYHERVKADIEGFGGTVEKFIGDAVMAVFGAPVAHEDDAERAVRSGLRVLDTIEELREQGIELSVRAAVTTGEAVVAVGARPERGEGIVTGDVVNTAARLQSAAPVGAVIVDELTMRSAEAAITCEELEPVEAKGKAEPIAVWRVLGARSRVGQPEVATQSPFIGREHERTLLLETFLRAERESSVQLVTVVGEPGIGKSRLVTELRSTLDARPDLITWRHGRCLPYGEGITFWALGEIVKAEAGILESDDQQVAASKLDDVLTALFSDESEQAWFASRLEPLVGARGEGAAVAREETFTAWRRFIEAMAARRTCVFVLEDLHWADAALLEFVDHVLDWSPPVPALLLCTARPELFERSPSWGGGKRNVTTISLSPLSTEESGRLLHLLLERSVLPAETQSLLLERAGGNPLYAEQFARMLVERGDVESLAVPETVQALIAARLDTLSSELKALLQVASVIGRVFWTGAVAEMTGRPCDDVRRDLNELARREFVRPVRLSSIDGEDEFSFWHALVRDVAYQRIPRTPRAQKHVSAARWIEDTAGERAADHAEILVHHYECAVELSRAAGEERSDLLDPLGRVLVLAGDRAMHLDVAAAEGAYRRALELTAAGPSRAACLVKLANALQEQGRLPEAEAAYEEALVPHREAGEERTSALAMLGLARAVWRRGDAARARELNVEAISILESTPGVDLVDAYQRAAASDAIGGRSREAVVWAERAMRLANELRIDNVARSLQMRGLARINLGEVEEGLDDLRAGLELAQRLGLGIDTAISYLNLGEMVSTFESLAAGLELTEASVAFSEQHGLTHNVMWARSARLFSLYELGEWDELLRESDEIVGWDRNLGGTQIEVMVLTATAPVLAHRGRLEEAQRAVEIFLPRSRAIGDPQAAGPALVEAALVAALQGRVDDAVVLAEEFESFAERARVDVLGALAAVARVCVAAARPDVAERLVRVVEGSSSPVARSALAYTRALLHEDRGEIDEAVALYREAVAGWEAWGSIVERAYALLGLGRCGDEGAAQEAKIIFERLGAKPFTTAARAA